MRSYPVLDPVSQAYPEVQGRSPTCYSPVRHSSTQASLGLSVRLACVKHAASVHPEPGSNSPTKTKNKTHQKTAGKKTIQPKKPDQNGSSQKTIQQKQTPTIKKQNVPKSSASKKQKTEKTKTPNQTARHPSQSHTNKTKKHTIENTNNQTTNQPKTISKGRCAKNARVSV